MARIAIIGPGAIGSLMAGWLSKSGGHEVFLCARRPLPPLRLETPSGTWPIRAHVWTHPSDAEPVEWILVATKTYDSAGAAAWLPRLRTDGTPVAVLQNGVEHRERFAGQVPDARLIPVVVECPAERSGPDLIRQRRPARIVIGNGELDRKFAALFADTAVEVAQTPDFRTAAWAKLCLNAAGAIPAILLEPAGVFHRDAAAEAARQLIAEAMAVGRAEGAVLPDNLPDTILETYRGQPADSVNSLHADCLAGRPTEIDARNGVIVRLGGKHGIATPCNRLAVALVRAREAPR